MKIKEIIEKTGLTDRAVRLYIEHGLVTPSNERSYTGRNNYSFTNEDLDTLLQIAALRKADFSIEQIKTLKEGGEAAREALTLYLKEKQDAVDTGQRIIEALKDIPENEDVTIEEICRRINGSLDGTSLPEADKTITKAEIAEKWIARSVALLILIPSSLFMLLIVKSYHDDFPFPKLYSDWSYYIGIAYLLFPVIISSVILILYRKNLLLTKKRIIRLAVTALSLIMVLINAINPIGIAFLSLVPPCYSETDESGNYLILGDNIKGYKGDIYKLFPINIPWRAIIKKSDLNDKYPDTTKYYYHYQDVVDPSFDIYAEWILPEEEFTEEINRIGNYYPEGAVSKEQWGDWVVLNFTDDPIIFEEAKKLDYYYYLIFAYNEKTGGVRYIASYAMDAVETDLPYFIKLEW